MSFRDEEELDWGEEEYRNPGCDEGDADAVDTLSLGDEDEIPQAECAVECEVYDTPPRATTPQIAPEPTSPNKNRSGNSLSSQSSVLGLSHLPAKPHTVVYGGRARETIKAAAMSRPAARSRSPPGSAPTDLPPNWEVRRSELTVYYYHTVLCASQIKKPTREDARLDTKLSWKGEEPPSPGRLPSQSARNAPSTRAAWPENSASGRHQKNNRASSPPPPGANSPSQRPNPPEETRRGRADSRSQQPQQQQQPPRPRSISPASMLLPRRGQSPARGLAKNGTDSNSDTRNDSASGNRSDSARAEVVQKPRREAWDRRSGRNQSPPPPMLDHYSPEPDVEERLPRNARATQDAEVLQAPRVTGSRRPKNYDDAPDTRGMDHYSPPPEGEKAHPKDTMRRSGSPPRRGGMRSDAMVFDQYPDRRSVSPRPHGSNRNFERPPIERGNFDSRSRPDLGRTRSDVDIPKGRGSGRGARGGRFGELVQRHADGEFAGPREEQYRGRGVRPSPRGRHTDLEIQPRHRPGPGSHAPDVEVFSPDVEEQVYPDMHPSRMERFHGRAEGPRPPRMGPVQPDMPMNPHLSPHALRNETPLPPRHDPNFESHGGYPRGQRPQNANRRRERPSSAHEHPPPPENDFNPANRNMMVPGPQHRDPTHSRDPNPRGRQQEHQMQDRTSQTWERGVEVPTPLPPPEQGRYDGRRQDNNGRKNWRGNEYPGRRHPSEEEPPYEENHAGQTPYGRPISPDTKRTYAPEERKWTPRQGHAPPRMEMDVDPEPPVRAEPLPGWAGFHRRDREEHVHERRSWGPKPWSGPEGEQPAPPADNDEEARKRRRVDDGSEVVISSHTEHERPRKIPPYRSQAQRPKPQSPVNSYNTLPNVMISPALAAPVPPVDPEVALARAQNIASQLSRTAPGSGRSKSRFAAGLNAVSPGASTGAPAAATDASSKPDVEPASSIKSPEMKAVREVSATFPETHAKTGTDSPSHKSDDSSAPLVSRLGDTSIGEEVSQHSEGRPPHRQDGHSRWKPNLLNRNTNDFRGGRNKSGDFWRPENDDIPRETPMRAWGKPNPGAHRDNQAAPGFVPNTERAFIPRDAVERNFAKNSQMAAHEGLPARPLVPSEFVPIPATSGGWRPPPSASRQQPSSSELPAGSPPLRERGLGHDGHPTDANLDAQLNARKRPADLSFRPTFQVGTPRKNSLLDRMTEPGGGELSLMARLSNVDQVPHDGHSQQQQQQQQQRQRRPKIKQAGSRR